MHAVTAKPGAWALALFVAAMIASGCGAPTPPPPPPATFTEVYAAMFPLGTPGQCLYCHNRPPNDLSNGKLNFGDTQASAYTALVNVASVSAKCSASGKKQVVPGDPQNSLFYLKLLDPPPCGDRMPQGGSPLSAEQLEKVRSWIAAGAKND